MTDIEELAEQLVEAPRQGPGAVARVTLALLPPGDISALTGVSRADLKAWRSGERLNLSPDAYDRLEHVRAIATTLLGKTPFAWTRAGLEAWFKARNLRLLDESGKPMTPLEALAKREPSEVLAAVRATTSR